MADKLRSVLGYSGDCCVFANRKVCSHTFSEVIVRLNITYPYLIIHLMLTEPYPAIINAFGSSSLWHWCYQQDFWCSIFINAVYLLQKFLS